MSFVRRISSVVLLTGVVIACAPTTQAPKITDAASAEEARRQRELAIRERVTLDQRLQAVAWRVRTSNVELCDDSVHAEAGMKTMVQEDDWPDFRPALLSLYGIQDQATILHTIVGGPAHLAGLQTGDVLLELDGQVVPGGKKGNEFLTEKIGESTGAVNLKIRRGQDEPVITLHPLQTCSFPVFLAANDAVNAFADGDKVHVTTGMMGFVGSDDELALIIGHELAHNAMNHIGKQRGNRMAGYIVGSVLDVFLGGTGAFARLGEQVAAGVHAQDFEEEADYVGVYYAARAGYDVKGAADLWRRMATSNPTAIHLAGSTHPSTAKRFLGVEATADEVVRKVAEGEPVRPNESKDKEDTPNTDAVSFDG